MKCVQRIPSFLVSVSSFGLGETCSVGNELISAPFYMMRYIWIQGKEMISMIGCVALWIQVPGETEALMP